MCKYMYVCVCTIVSLECSPVTTAAGQPETWSRETNTLNQERD